MDTFDFEPPAFRWQEYAIEDYCSLVIFWVLAFNVFLQFFSRYVMGDSIAWTEEMARYLLVMVAFLGSTMAMRRGSHIAVEFFYRYLQPTIAKGLNVFVDIVSMTFFAAMAWISLKMANQTNAMMVSVDIPKSVLYYLVFMSFLIMLMRAAQVMLQHFRQSPEEIAKEIP